MANAPMRDVGAIGLVTDRLPHDLPLNAWSDARNVRFSNGRVSRYSAFKHYDPSYTFTKTPVGLVDGGLGYAEGYVVTVFSDGTMEQNHNGVISDVTPTGNLGASLDKVTSCSLGGVTYINRAADIPSYRYQPSSGAFSPLAGWSATDRCVSLRAFKDFLIALNVTKSGVEYPQMIKWSDAAQIGAPPSNWDTASGSSLAGENVLNDCSTGIVDGYALAESFIIYAETQTFRMDYINKPFIFRTVKLFDDKGIMSQNCVTAVDGRHYVFGNNDLYMHDGLTGVSIADDRIKAQVFSEIDMDQKKRCFVYHDHTKGDIGFCYPSISNEAPWSREDSTGCNRAAVFNYKDNTWTLVDLPSLIDSASIAQITGVSWEDMNAWSANASKWNSFDGAKPKNLLVLSSGNTALTVPAQLYFVDDLSSGRLSNAVAADILWEAHATRTHIDLDELGLEIYGRKQVRSIVPQIKTGDPEDVVKLSVGYCTGVNTDVTWGQSMDFKAWTDDKYDTRINHRYLALRFVMPVGVDAEISGYDADIIKVSGR